jgi:hypothetical protein
MDSTSVPPPHSSTFVARDDAPLIGEPPQRAGAEQSKAAASSRGGARYQLRSAASRKRIEWRQP